MAVARNGERGSASLKLLITLLVMGILAYAGFLYVPVAYNAHLFKDLMEHNVNAASALAHPPAWVKEQLVKAAPEYGVPPDAVITPSQQNNRMEVRVQFSRAIEFPGYTHQYEFDHTARSTDFFK